MKIALVLPPMTLEERYGKAIAKVGGTFPPLGLISLGTYLKKYNYDVKILDGSRMDYASMLNILSEYKPDIIGITTMTFVWEKVKKIIIELKQKFPQTFIVIGGAHATMYRKVCMNESPLLDAVVYGEGENTLVELMQAVQNKGKLSNISGLIYRENGIIIEAPPRELIDDIDSLPIPDRSLVNISEYVPAFSQYRKLPVTNMFTTRGCPSKCIFCFPEVLGRKVRYRSPESVISEIRYLQEKYGIRDIAFWDDTFTLNRKRVLEITQLIIKNKIQLSWAAQARADRVDKELLTAMRESGCWKLHFGLESMVQKNLDFLRKGTTVEQNANAARAAKEAGIEVEASFIFGIPGETFEDGLKTIQYIKEMNIDYARFFPLTPYGELKEKFRDYGVLVSDDMSKYQGNEIVFVPYSMTREELEKLISLAYTKFYFRFGYIAKRIRKLANIRSLRDTFRGARAVYLIATKGIGKV